ncbi:MAG: hypothetical protein P8188_09730 [Gemmatimonadota bacterium]|jgi:hypothetical protein
MTSRRKSALALILSVAFAGCADTADTPTGPEVPDVARAAGHGAPKGSHDYQLNIIGTGDKSAAMDDNNGRRIFVPLDGKTKIYLFEGEYAVLDANATDGRGEFQLPAPGLDAYIVGDPGDADVQSSYSVFVRPLGKPGGWATITTCADLLDSTFGGLLGGADRRVLNRQEATAYCSIEQVGAEITERKAGKSTFSNVTAELTTIVFEVEILDEEGNVIDTVEVRVPIFDDALENEYWEYDNNGLRLLQVRFYDCSTNVETGASTCG